MLESDEKSTRSGSCVFGGFGLFPMISEVVFPAFSSIGRSPGGAAPATSAGAAPGATVVVGAADYTYYIFGLSCLNVAADLLG